jgi:hypothetical protein
MNFRTMNFDVIGWKGNSAEISLFCANGWLSDFVVGKLYQVLFHMHNDYSVPQGFSITMSQVSSDCRRRTMVPLPLRLIGLPSGSIPLIDHSVIRRAKLPT